ncbi:hypothetical protein AAFC00_006602 [Neodothiora populina]|uniref:DNA ligase n=1 Tax=Neodothiora populina TaxID=2781224 RepID=A0ABR3PAH9_9PEZI
MSAPNKRRKISSHEASPKKVNRGLDYFFGKQQLKKNDPSPAVNGRGKDEGNLGEEGDRVDEILSDEALARKLQAEWEEQDRQQHALTNGSTEGAKEAPIPAVLPVKEEVMVEALRTTKTESSTQVEPALPVSTDKQKPKPINPFASFGSTKKNTLSLQSATADDDSMTYEIPFDSSPLTFDPQKYVPELKKQWAAEGGKVTYALLTHCFILVNSTTSRIKIVDTLVNTLRVIIESDPESLLPAVWLATNSISPPYIDLELGLGGSAISKALKKVCGLDGPGLKKLYDKHGDAGDVAFEAKKRQSLTLRKPKPLTVKSVYDSLYKIANSKGHGSVEVKQRIVERLVQDARGAEESRYIVRTLVQHLRIGAVKTTMLIALSRAFLLSRPPGAQFELKDPAQLAKLSKQDLALVYAPAEELVKACFARRPNYNDLVPTLLEIGINHEELLLRCGLAMHIPLRPMLGGITRDLGEMLTKLQGRQFTCEYKYDGQRAQVHCDANGKVTIFSRHLEVMTDKYPDLVALVPKIRGEGVRSFIIEGEVVAIDKETGELKPFQVLSNRARKDVVIGSVKVDVCLFAFDLMYLNGEELLDRPMRERRSLLRSLFVELPHHFTWVKSIDATSADVDIVSEFFKQAIADKCEGFMAKVLDNLPDADVRIDGVDGATPPPIEAAESKVPLTPSKRKRTNNKSKTAATNKSTTAATANSDDINNLDEEDESSDKKTSGRRKALLATYEPDKRLDSWLKVKKDYDTTAANPNGFGFAETIDLIPIGAWHGQGRKSKWWSPILLAARNEETGMLEAVTKCMSGFTDAFYKENRIRYDPDVSVDSDDDEDDDSDDADESNDDNGAMTTIPRPSSKNKNNTLHKKPPYLSYAHTPDIWFSPQEVWEISFADITLSPTYTAAIGMVSEERGLSLRFPRFLRVRNDKGIDDASSTAFLAGLWWKQEGVGKTSASSAGLDKKQVNGQGIGEEGDGNGDRQEMEGEEEEEKREREDEKQMEEEDDADQLLLAAGEEE